MSLQFYKPNSKSKGTACSFWRSSEDNPFWASLIKQESWNTKTRTGSFSKNKDNPKKRVIVKFSDTEMAGFIDAIERNAEYSGYHRSDQIVRFKFGPYTPKKIKVNGEFIANDKQQGFSLSVTKEDKEDSTDSQNYLIGFNYPEGMRLKIYLQTILMESYKVDYNPQKSSPKEKDEENEDYEF